MTFVQLIELLGQIADHPQISKHLVEAGITWQPRPAPDEDSAYVQFKDQGYEMRFEADPADGTRVVLVTLTSFLNGDETHVPFVGELPLGISALESRSHLVARLGTPAVRNERYNIDMWKLDALDVVVSYDGADSTVDQVQVNVPDK
jgi:hypothetical protein